MAHAGRTGYRRRIAVRATLLFATFTALTILSMAASGQQNIWLKSRWKQDQYIHIENGAAQCGPIQAGWASAAWTVEPVPGTGFRRLRNQWKPDQYLHIESGRLQAGPIQPGWQSAMWVIEPVSGENFSRLRNVWKPDQYIHIENGTLQAGPIQSGWHSAMWALDTAAPGARVAAVPAQQPSTQPPVTSRPPAGASTLAPAKPSAEAIAQRVIFGESDPDICWKDSYGRGAGKVPDACPSGFERTGADLLCYPICRAGFSGVGPVCWQNCPAGYRNDGGHCAKPEAYGRGTGYAYNVFTEGRSAAQQRCERDHGAGRCERNLEMFYPLCKSGYKEFGSNICTPVCPAGMTDIGVSCQKQSYGRTVGEGATCDVASEQDFKGGLCYPKCRAGATGVGPVCWNGCPAAFPVNCGAACGVSQTACAMAIMDQVQSSAEVALNVAALIASAGASSSAMRAAETAGRSARQSASKAARDQIKSQAKHQLENAMKWQKRVQRVERVQGWLEKAGNVDKAAEILVDAREKGQFDYTTLIPSVADVEPTGILSMVNSFNKPICR